MNVTIYRSTRAVIKTKMHHVHTRGKKGKSLHYGFTLDNGDIPVADINSDTGVVHPVVNTRGNAYATRNRLKFRRRKTDESTKEIY